MTSIFFLTETIYCNMFRCKYLRKKKVFLNIFLHFRSLDSILKIFKKKMTLIADVILNLRTPKMWLDKCLKSPVSEDPSTGNMANAPKHCSKLIETTFAIFIDHCEGNSIEKSLSKWYAKS